MYNQALADVQSTGAGIKYLYCSFDLQPTWVIDVLGLFF